ncbi:Flp family type IVb pilin [Roseiconus lacunae]|uniref:Flp family type IVb pilin n=1 Tax=Roseiconus lacunae TaxID=2605694 RepID=UPI0011F0DEB3|nr:hypothetical protein [Roseiconus lacunae]
MTRKLSAFYRDESGAIVSVEAVFLATIVVVGLLVAFTAIRDGVVEELADTASGVQEINQSYELRGVVGRSAQTAGAGFEDHSDYLYGQRDACVIFNIPPGNSEGKWDVTDYGGRVVFGN